MPRNRAQTERTTKCITILRLSNEILNYELNDKQTDRLIRKIESKFDKAYERLYGTDQREINLRGEDVWSQLRDGETYRLSKTQHSYTITEGEKLRFLQNYLAPIYRIRIQGSAPESPTQLVEVLELTAGAVKEAYMRHNQLDESNYSVALLLSDGKTLEERAIIDTDTPLRVNLEFIGNDLEQPGPVLRNVVELTFRSLYIWDIESFRHNFYGYKNVIGSTKDVLLAIMHGLSDHDKRMRPWLQELSCKYAEYNDPKTWRDMTSLYEDTSDEICHMANAGALPNFTHLATQVMKEAAKNNRSTINQFVKTLIPQPAIRHLKPKENTVIRLCIGILGFLEEKGLDLSAVIVTHRLHYEKKVVIAGTGSEVMCANWGQLTKRGIYDSLTKGEYRDKSCIVHSNKELRAYGVSVGIDESSCIFPEML